MSENNAYVYGHYKATTGELFYIGKGTGNRAWSTKDRNNRWMCTVDKHGIEVKILYKNLSEEDAFQKEMELIKEIGLENLTNITEGGDGFTSEFAKNLWNNEETRNKMLKGIREANSRPEFRQNRSKHQKNRMKDASLRKTISEKMQGNTNGVDIWKNEERKKLMAERRKEQWKDEEYRNKNLSGRKKYKETGGKGPNAGKKFDKITRKYYIPTELT
jgi:hypothetical protein